MIQRGLTCSEDALFGTVHLGDCLPWLRERGTLSVDLVFADPPYNQGKDYGPSGDALPWEDYWAWAAEWVAECERIARRGVALYLPHRLVRGYWNLLPSASQVVIRKRARGTVQYGWVRQYHVLLTTAEAVGKPMTDFIEDIRLPGEGYFFREERPPHPAFTSEKLTERVLEMLTLPEEVVCDPFMGTGTTLAVATRMGRRALGCEANAEFRTYALGRQLSLEPAGEGTR